MQRFPHCCTISLANHVHITHHHMRNHGNDEECDKTAWFTLNKQIDLAADMSHMRSGQVLYVCCDCIRNCIEYSADSIRMYGD